MTSIFSTISGQFGKAWILGALLPAALCVVLGLVFLQPLLPFAWQVVGSLAELDTTGLLAVSLATLLLSGLLFQLNTPLLRFYEGYPWAHGLLGQWRVRRHQRRFDEMDARWRGMRTLLRALPDRESDDYAEIYHWWSWTGFRQNRELPANRALVLPTRFGNVMRSFEEYPDVQYGIDAIAFWPHLFAAIGKDEAALIEDEKIGVDFMLNTSFLLGVLSATTLFAGLTDPFPLASWEGVPWQWLVQITTFAGLGYLFYLGAITRAETWGTTVRAAFDANRWTMLQRLGYPEVPKTLETERELCDQLSRDMLRREVSRRIGVAMSGPAATYNLHTFVQAIPNGVALALWRAVDPERTKNGKTQGPWIVLSVSNADKRAATDVVVTDTIPEGFGLKAGSVRVALRAGSMNIERDQVTVRGTNPYQFEIGDIKAGQQKLVRYEVVKHG
jgi:hypothetical protein